MSLSRFPRHRPRLLAVGVAAATAASITLVPTATAAPDGSDVVINEVYGGGGNSGALLTNDFVELYNPTDEDLDVTGMRVEYWSATGGSGGSATLSGIIPAQGHYLINMAAGNGGEITAEADATGGANMSGTNGAVRLFDADGVEIDLVGYGNVAEDRSEGSPTPGLNNTTSAQRSPEGHDTDDNAADFVLGTPSPTNSEGVTFGEGSPGDPADPVDPPEPGEIVPIAEIQGTGPATPLEGRTVTTEGVVTGVYGDGGRNGFYLQTPGTGGELQEVGDASHGIFVHVGGGGEYPEIGESLIVTGQAAEYFEVTQLTNPTLTVPAEEFAPVTPVEIEHLPAGDEAREAYESMLVQPTGDYTVSDNYALNTFGEIGLAPGTEPFRQATDIHAPDTDPNSPVQQLMARQEAEEVLLDDGRTPNYMTSDTETPLPYIATDGTPHQSIRTGDAVEFQNPVVVHYSHDFWRFQPTTPITGENSADELPITWEDSRAAELDAIGDVDGDYSIASFNVLNYFTSLGENEPGCDAYTDRHGNPVAANYCDVRGAYTPEAFEDQQAKIVEAINRLDVDVLGLEEIENTATVTGDVNRRDDALNTLVDELNAAGGNWAAVPSPQQLGTDEDYIRVAFIYNPDTVEMVGESRIFDDPAFTGTARQPLAQEFAPVDGSDESFVAVVNHFKSKGSVTRGDRDRGDGQGNNPTVRANQSQALLDRLAEQEDWEGKPTFILGDINSYTEEDAMRVLENGGFTNINKSHAGNEPTYQFSGRLGSLDHALGNDAAMELVQDARVWNINADEPIAYEYSRRNYNVVDFYDDSPFRSSDHDPIKVGFNLGEPAAPGEEPDEPGQVLSFEINAEGHLVVTYADGTTEDLGRVAGSDGADGADGSDGSDGRGIASLVIDEGGHLMVTYTDGTTEDVGRVAGSDGADGQDGTDGRAIDGFEVNDEGHLVVTYTDGTTEDLGPVTGTDGAEGTDGSDGRGIASLEISDEGHLLVTYTDGTTEDLGRVVGEDGTDGSDGADGADGTDGGSSSGPLETVLAFGAGLVATGGLVGWIVNTFFPEIRDGVVNQFNSLFR